MARCQMEAEIPHCPSQRLAWLRKWGTWGDAISPLLRKRNLHVKSDDQGGYQDFSLSKSAKNGIQLSRLKYYMKLFTRAENRQTGLLKYHTLQSSSNQWKLLERPKMTWTGVWKVRYLWIRQNLKKEAFQYLEINQIMLRFGVYFWSSWECK